MPRKSHVVCLGLSTLLASSAPAEPVDYPIDTVGGLLSACAYEGDDQGEVDYQFGICVGTVKGMINAARAIAEASGHDEGMCIGEDVDDEQLVGVAVEALEAWSGAEEDNPAPAVLGGLLEAFPCTPDPLEKD